MHAGRTKSLNIASLNFNISLNSSGNGFSIHVGEVKESEMGSKGQRLSVAEVF
jgi:hypothetical protein